MIKKIIIDFLGFISGSLYILLKIIGFGYFIGKFPLIHTLKRVVKYFVFNLQSWQTNNLSIPLTGGDDAAKTIPTMVPPTQIHHQMMRDRDMDRERDKDSSIRERENESMTREDERDRERARSQYRHKERSITLNKILAILL